MFTSILILAKNEAANIERCLENIFSQDTGCGYETLLIDSGSTDGTLEKARKFPVRIVQIPPEQFHHAKTRNYAAEIAQGNILVYLAADAFPASENWLEAMAGNFDEPTVGAVYGRQIPKPGSRAERRQALETLYGESRIVKEPGRRADLGYRYYHLSTVNAAIRKDVWEKTRFPDELRVFEDVAIAKRILDGGWKIVYEPAAPVYHSHDYPAHILFRRYFDIGVVYERLGLWDNSYTGSMQREGWQLLKKKLSLLGEGRWREFGENVFYDAVKYSGIVSGRNERFIPLPVKRKLSCFGVFD